MCVWCGWGGGHVDKVLKRTVGERSLQPVTHQENRSVGRRVDVGGELHQDVHVEYALYGSQRVGQREVGGCRRIRQSTGQPDLVQHFHHGLEPQLFLRIWHKDNENVFSFIKLY